MLTRCDDGRSELQGWKAVISHREGAPRTSPKQLGLVHVTFQPISRHPVVNVHDALLKSSDGRRHVIGTTVQVQLCAVCKRQTDNLGFSLIAPELRSLIVCTTLSKK